MLWIIVFFVGRVLQGTLFVKHADYMSCASRPRYIGTLNSKLKVGIVYDFEPQSRHPS